MTRPSACALVVLAVSLGSSCAHGGKNVAKAPHAPGAATDQAAALIAGADAHLQAGLAQARAGHLNAARAEFDQSVDAYLTAPGGAYADARVAEAYRRTLETIHVHELEALSAGDGFSEPPAEPASIDELAQLRLEDHANDETRRAAEEIVRQSSIDLPLTINDAVLSCVDLYQGSLRDWFAGALQRGSRYLPRIREVFASEGIPQDLAYVALVESAFKTSALSRAQARGMWQFIPETGREYGLKQDWWVDERSDPDKATHAAAQYLRSLYDTFGDWNLALAAYNAGPGRIVRQLGRTGATDYWDLVRAGALPRETENYVPMIQAAIVVAKAPDKYGFDVPAAAAADVERVSVKGAVDLRVVAECAGTSVDDVRGMNPALRRLATPANRSFDVAVPLGTGKKVATCIASIPPEKRVTFRTHVVARGQTLQSIARRYGVRATDVASANSLRGKTLARGTELIIPIEGRTASAPRAMQAAAAPAAEPGPTRGSAAPRTQRVEYRVKSGDTLHSIAARYRTTVQNLASWNRLRGTRLAAGNVLTIYTSRKF